MSKLHNKALDICGVGAKVPMGTDTMRKVSRPCRVWPFASLGLMASSV